jgi:hypothetical protein
MEDVTERTTITLVCENNKFEVLPTFAYSGKITQHRTQQWNPENLK